MEPPGALKLWKTMFKLCAEISKVDWSSTEKEKISNALEFLKKSSREEAFFNYCKQHKLAPWTYIQLVNSGLISHIKKPFNEDFKAEYLKVKDQNTRRIEAIKEVFQAFIQSNIDVIILKGNLFLHTVYEDVGYKKMNDFDILVHKKDWDKIQDIYLSLGFIPLGFGWSGEKEKPAEFSHVGMSFISRDFSCIIGTQWGLKSPTTTYKVPVQKAWESAKSFDFYSLPVKKLNCEFNLLHLILHLGIYKCGIRDLMDIYNLSLKQDFDETYFLNLIAEANAKEKAYFALTLSNLCAGVFPRELLGKLKPDKPRFLSRRLNKRLANFQQTEDLHNSYNDYFQDVEKQVIYFNLFPQFHRKLFFYFRILRMIFFPKKSIALKLDDAGNQKNILAALKSKLKAPYYVFSLIAQEIGRKFTLLLFFKLLFDLIFSLKNYVHRPPSYFDYLKRKDIDPNAIERAVQNIE